MRDYESQDLKSGKIFLLRAKNVLTFSRFCGIIGTESNIVRQDMMRETHLYNCKSTPEPGAWVITKFDDDLNVLSTYLVTPRDCACPRGNKHCRHKTMLGYFKRHQHVDDGWFLGWNSSGPAQPMWTEPLDTFEAMAAVSNEFDAEDFAPAPAPPPAVPVLPPAVQVAGAPIKRRKLGNG